MPRRSAPLALAIATLLGGVALAHGPAPTHGLRQLSLDAHVIVRATPCTRYDRTPRGPVRFRVDEVLRGKAVKAGQEIRVEGLRGYPLESFWGDRKPPVVVGALLYLTHGKSGSFQVTLSGVRFHSQAGQVLLPVVESSPGFYQPVPILAGWKKTLALARRVAQESEAVLALRKVREPAKRNRRLMAWIEAHRAELSWASAGGNFQQDPLTKGPGLAHEPSGWGRLEAELFEWIFETRLPADCWRAIQLHRRLAPRFSSYGPYPGDLKPFAGAAGRRFLIKIVEDETRKAAERRLALEWLSFGSDVDALRGAERAAIRDLVLRILEDRRSNARPVAARMLWGLVDARPGAAVVRRLRALNRA